MVDEQPREVTISLTREGTQVDDAVVELVGQANGELHACAPQDGAYRVAAPPGMYSVRADDPVLGEQSLSDVAVSVRRSETILFELAPPAAATLSVAPVPADAGGEVTLTVGAVEGLPGWVGLAPRQLGVEGVAEWSGSPAPRRSCGCPTGRAGSWPVTSTFRPAAGGVVATNPSEPGRGGRACRRRGGRPAAELHGDLGTAWERGRPGAA
jgi:hypothetical protein